MTSRMFPLGQVLTVIHDRLVCTVDELYEILNFLTGANLYTHQLVRAGRIAQTYLAEQFPSLAAVEIPDYSTAEEYQAWLSDLTEQLGDEVLLEPLPEGAYEEMDPIEELQQMAPGKPVITVAIGDTKFEVSP